MLALFCYLHCRYAVCVNRVAFYVPPRESSDCNVKELHDAPGHDALQYKQLRLRVCEVDVLEGRTCFI